MLLIEIVNDINELTAHLHDASIRKAMDVFGGCKHYKETDYPARFRKYVRAYVEQNKDSNQCIADYLFDNHYLSEMIKNI